MVKNGIEKILLAPKEILLKAKLLQANHEYKKALQLLKDSSVEVEIVQRIIKIKLNSKTQFEKLSQPNKVKRVKSRFPDRIWNGS